jgi:hypothetical protein
MRMRRHLARPRHGVLLVVVATALAMVIAACGDDTWESATTAARTTTAAATTTTTSTVPSLIVAGHVCLLDGDVPVLTAVDLVREEEEEEESAATTRTDADGHYSFSIEDAGSCQVEVSAFDLLEGCDNLTTSGEMTALPPAVKRFLSGSGTADVLAVSLPEPVAIGGEATFDLDLYCD